MTELSSGSPSSDVTAVTDRDALAVVIHSTFCTQPGSCDNQVNRSALRVADAVLSSDWLAGRDERIRAEERQGCAVEARKVLREEAARTYAERDANEGYDEHFSATTTAAGRAYDWASELAVHAIRDLHLSKKEETA